MSADTSHRQRNLPSITDPTLGAAPRRTYSRLWLNRWMTILRTVGNVQAWIILTLFYVVILTPFGFLYRRFADPLRLRRRAANWQPLPRQYDTTEQALEQS